MLSESMVTIIEQIIFIVLGALVFLGIYFISSYVLKYIMKYRHNRLLNASEYLPKEERLTLQQVFFLIIITLCFVDIIYSIVFWALAYVIKLYYGKFIHFTESNGLVISILLLFGIVFVSFIFTSFAEQKNLLDALVMVSNAFTSNGYAVLGDTPIGKLNSIFLVWGGYIISGVGTATLTAALVSRHFNKKFEDLEELIKNNNANINNDSKKED